LIGLCLLQAGLVPEAMHHRAHGHHARALPSHKPPTSGLGHLNAGATDRHDPHHCAICQAIKAYRFCWVGFEDSATSSLAPAIAPNRLSVARFHASALAISAPRAPPVWSPTPA
jgi:hypothetical protein